MFTDLFRSIQIIENNKQLTKDELIETNTNYSHAQPMNIYETGNHSSQKINMMETCVLLEICKVYRPQDDNYESARRCLFISIQSIFPLFSFIFYVFCCSLGKNNYCEFISTLFKFRLPQSISSTLSML